MGQVFEVRHKLIKRRGALKFLHPHLVSDEEIVARFIHEAQSAAAIGSEFIVDITDAGVTADRIPYLVMEYLDGEDLSRVLQEAGPFDQQRAAYLMAQVCRGLMAAHRQGIIHRDLKPENLLLISGPDGGERIKILDFGMAKFRDMSITSSQGTFGSPYYMAPEQFFGAKKVDHRADIYSVGVILYELLTGARPFEGGSVGELVYAVTMSTATPPRQLRDDLLPDLERLVLKAMSVKLEERYQSVAELAEALSILASPSAVRVDSGGPEQVRVPAGSFEMGSPPEEEGRFDDEEPHRVELTRPFYLCVRPVTQMEWQSLMGSNPAYNIGPDRPVEMVSWFDAVAFCNALSRSQHLEEAYRLDDVRGRPGEPGFSATVFWKGLDCPGYRLPTEAEWEYACRANVAGARYGSLDAAGWYADNSGGSTQPVGMKRPNELGLYDMLGNVWEWCWDWYGTYPEGEVTDPIGPDIGFGRVDRGGAWDSAAELCRAADRDGFLPGSRHHNLGFRPARTAFDDNE